MDRHRGHYLANAGVAIYVVQAEQRRNGLAADELDRRQLRRTRRVIRADRRRFLHPTRERLIVRLHGIAHHTGDDAA